jgi:putative Holliday junction resolvase
VSKDSGVVLAFDFGMRRIGIASGNVLTRTASPLTTLSIRHDLPWEALDRLVADWHPSVLVVGQPPGAGAATLAQHIQTFAEALERRYRLRVELVDETLTSEAARADLKEKRRSGFLRRRVGKGRLDRHAACLIAEQWLNGSANGH